MKTLTMQLIECEAGWQCECELLRGWTTYSAIRQSKEDAKAFAERFAKAMKMELVWDENKESAQ